MRKQFNPPTTISNQWIPVSVPPPNQARQYKVRFTNGVEGVAFWVLKASGERDWLTLPGYEVAYYQPIINNL